MKKIIIILSFLGILNLNAVSQIIISPMILEYDTNLSGGTTITLPLNGTVNVTINWGDGNTESVNIAGQKNHTYASEGVYTVKIFGTLTHFGINTFSTNQEKLVRVTDFGNIGLTDLSYAFYNAVNLIEVPETLPATVTNLQACFFNASSFNFVSHK